MKIKIDDWECAHSDSSFEIEVDVVPRVGELVSLHFSVCENSFVKDHEEDFAEDKAIDGYASFVVVEVEHRYGPNGIEVTVDVTPKSLA